MGWEAEDGTWAAPPQPPPEGWFIVSSRETRVLDRPSWLNVRQHLGIIYTAEFWGTVYCGPRSDDTGLFYDLKSCADRELCPMNAVFAFGPGRQMVLPKLWTKEPYEQWEPGYGWNAERHNPTATRNKVEREASQQGVIDQFLQYRDAYYYDYEDQRDDHVAHAINRVMMLLNIPGAWHAEPGLAWDEL
jgi:hypothetical protein